MFACEKEEESPLEEGTTSTTSDDSSTGSSDDSSSNSTVEAPSSPSGLSVSYQYDFDDTPTVSVSGVTSGDTVKIYSNSDCSTEVGSATASSTSVDVTVSSAISVGSELIQKYQHHSLEEGPVLPKLDISR